jgi:hypothetical protein
LSFSFAFNAGTSWPPESFDNIFPFTGRLVTILNNNKNILQCLRFAVYASKRIIDAGLPARKGFVNNFFMPTQKLKSKTRVGSKEIKVYDEPRGLFQMLMENRELDKEYKDTLERQHALSTRWNFNRMSTSLFPLLCQRLVQTNRIQTQERE